MPDYVVALDLGGTLTKVAYADASGAISPPTRLPTLIRDGRVSVDWLAQVLADTVQSRPDQRCRGYGVVVPGIIDVERGVVRAATNLGWYDVAVGDRLAAATGLPGVLAHDVRSGGLAEWRLGAARGVRNLLFLPLGTGIAGAVVADARLVDADGYAGEIGHLAVQAGVGRDCACGQQGCLETVASATGVTRSYAEASGVTVVDAAAVADLARQGDPAARAAFDRAVAGLGEALVTYVTLLAPEVVVLGGGLAGAYDLVGPPLSAALEARLTFQRRPRLLRAALGADAGVIGAGLVGWDHVRAQARGQEDR